MIVFGTKFWAWGSSLTRDLWRCAKCGYEGQFIEKRGMRFITFYWIIPTIPISGVKPLVQCPKCKSRYENNNPPPQNGTSQNGGPSSMETHSTPPIALP